MTCYAVSELGTVDFVDQLLALDSGHSGLACLLVFSVAVACNCPQTICQHLVCVGQLVLFAAGSRLSCTGLSTAPLPCTLLETVVPVFWLCTFVALWIVLWATQGLPSRASVFRGCPCRDPPVCLDAQGGIKARRQPFVVVGVWSCQCLVVVQTKST